MMSFEEVDKAFVDELLNVNIKSIIFGIKFAMISMKEKGIKGSIVVNTSVMSHAAKSNMPKSGVYAATKSAGDMLVQYAAIEGAENGAHPVWHRSINCKKPCITALLTLLRPILTTACFCSYIPFPPTCP
jgi:NAD(P)-dependent dehydrogenase (short-subunit alcohol dehydrogenase family)